MKQTYEINDKCWIHLAFLTHGAHKHDRLTEATVVHKFKLDYGPEYYVVEIQTPVDPVLEVRSAVTMSEDATGPIGLHRGR